MVRAISLLMIRVCAAQAVHDRIASIRQGTCRFKLAKSTLPARKKTCMPGLEQHRVHAVRDGKAALVRASMPGTRLMKFIMKLNTYHPRTSRQLCQKEWNVLFACRLGNYLIYIKP
jgi:hypothetical protein